MRNRNRILTTSALTVTLLGAVATPAFADDSTCDFTSSEYNCQTGPVRANQSSHSVTVTVWGRGASCTVYDNRTWIDVGSVRNGGTKTINGLYGTYIAICVGSEGGSGRLRS
jgi:hypothetical protein